jgi:RNA polymerase sigma factor (TIGR02999 family)
MSDVTIILQKIDSGDQQAANDLLPLVYEELRKLAHSKMSPEAADHTLQPTALVHEAYMRLVGGQPQMWQSRGHFFSAAAEAMRRILIDSARARKGQKRDRGASLPMPESGKESILNSPERLLELDEALSKLEKEDAQLAQLVRLRLYAGLTFADLASTLDISNSTAHEWWTFALKWFQIELQDD